MQKIILFIAAPLFVMLALVGGGGGIANAGKNLANGVACTSSSDCDSGNCTFKVCKAKSGGGKKLGNGVACSSSSDCDSGNCTFKVCKKR